MVDNVQDIVILITLTGVIIQVSYYFFNIPEKYPHSSILAKNSSGILRTLTQSRYSAKLWLI